MPLLRTYGLALVPDCRLRPVVRPALGFLFQQPGSDVGRPVPFPAEGFVLPPHPVHRRFVNAGSPTSLRSTHPGRYPVQEHGSPIRGILGPAFTGLTSLSTSLTDICTLVHVSTPNWSDQCFPKPGYPWIATRYPRRAFACLASSSGR